MHQRIKAARLNARLTQQDLARTCGVSRAAVAQWETYRDERRTQPRHALLNVIANATGVSVGWLLDDQAEISFDTQVKVAQEHLNENIGDILSGNPSSVPAYQPQGTLLELGHATIPQGSRDIPIISWANASFDLNAGDFLEPGDAIDWVRDYDGQCSRYTYALVVRGESMWPEYFEDDVIIVDPEVQPEQGRDVVVRNAETDDVTLKRFVMEGTRAYLKAINKDYPDPIRIVSEFDRFCGVVIDMRRRPRWRK